MAKFYVQSGSVQAVVDSADLDRAALWVVHQVMGKTLPIEELDDEPYELTNIVAPVRGHFLDETIRISEVGFHREDAMVVDTLETFRHWYELFQAVSILSTRLN
jgi:hypothetical protein